MNKDLFEKLKNYIFDNANKYSIISSPEGGSVSTTTIKPSNTDLIIYATAKGDLLELFYFNEIGIYETIVIGSTLERSDSNVMNEIAFRKHLSGEVTIDIDI